MKQYAFSIKSEKVDSSSQPPSVKPSYYQETLNHLIRMGMTRGWKEHTWFRVQELESHPLGLWKGIQQEFLREIDNAKTKVRTYEELQANRNQVDPQTLRGVDQAGGSEVVAGTTPEVIGK
jgi:hypothetical protein